MTKIISQIREKLESIGGTLDAGDYSLHLDAPSGYIWRATGRPSLSIHYATNMQTWLAKAYRDEKDNIKMGLDKVTESEDLEEHRWNLGDDNWGAAPEAPARIEWPK